MKKVVMMIWAVAILIWNMPFTLSYAFLSLWHWDAKYVIDFSEDLLEAVVKHINVFK